MANILGTTPERVFTKNIGESFSDSEIKMLEKALAQSTAHVAELAAKAVETGNEADIAAATSAYLRHDMIQGLYSQAGAEAGRATRAMRKSQEFWTAATLGQSDFLRQATQDATGRTPEQMLTLFQKITTFNQTGQLNKFLRNSRKSGLFDWLEAGWTNAILSNPITHATYSVAGQVGALYREFWQTPWQGLVGNVRAAVTGAQEHAMFRQVVRQAYGHLSGSLNGLRAGWSAIRENQQVLPAEVRALAKTISEKAARGEKLSEVEKEFAKSAHGQAVQQAGGIIPGRTGKVLESPNRMVAALHSFNWTAFYEQSKGVLAFQTAQNEGLQVGSYDFARRVADLTQNPTTAIIHEASKQADAGALVTRAPYDSIMGAVSRVMHRGRYFEPVKMFGKELPLGTFRPGMYIDPFIQIQGNILRTAYLDGTPLELFSKGARDDLAMRNGGLAFDLRAGKILAGTSFLLGAGALYYAGHLNDSGPSDPVKAYWWRQVHGMPHGLNIGNLSFNVLRMGRLGMQMSVAADLAHAAGDIPSGDMAKLAADLTHAVSQNIVDESFFEGPQRMLEAINNSDRYGAPWIRQFVASSVPFSGALRGAAHMIDPYTRDVRSSMDAIKNILPGVSETLNPRYNYWGQPIANQGWAGTNYEHLQNDPVDAKLDALGIAPRMPQRDLRGVQLTDDQYADYSREAGRLARQQVELVLRTPGFDNFPPGAQIDMIDKAVGVGHRVAATKIIGQSRITGDNSILDIAAQRKRAHFETGTPVRQPAH